MSFVSSRNLLGLGHGEAIPYSAGWQIPPFKNRGRLVINDGGQQETRTFILTDKHCGIALAMNLEADIYGPIVLRLYEVILGEPLEMIR